MLFKRREKPHIRERAQAWLWPKRGWRRAMEYVRHRLTRLSGSPHAIALGFAAGVFASFTPFMGFHFIIGAVAALAIGGNVIASALGTFAGNPLTFPFIWFSTFSFGNFLLGIEGKGGARSKFADMSVWATLTDPSSLFSDFWTSLWPLIKPMTVGGVPLGMSMAVIFYCLVRIIVGTYQNNRRRRLRLREGARRRKKTKSGPRAGRVQSNADKLL